ncbi:MAG: hypothetical protein ACJAR3_001079 [Roseivirga sp.]|jgi:hypothetical protein
MTKFRKTYLSLFLLSSLLAFTSCNQNEEEKVQAEIRSYSAEIVDSLVINRLSVVELLDYQSSAGEFLIFDTQTGEHLIMNEKAEILSSFNPYLQGPSYMGFSYGWSFYGQDELVAYGQSYYYRYSKSGEILGKYEPPIDKGGGVQLDYSPQRIRAFETERGTEVLTMFISNFNSKRQPNEDPNDVIFRMNFETGETIPAMQKAPDNIYRTVGKYIDPGYPTFTLLSGSTFAYTHQSDGFLYIFDAEKNQNINKIAIPEEFLPQFKGVDFDGKDNSEQLRINANVYSVDGKALLLSSGRIPNAIIKEIQQNPNWFRSPEFKAAQKKYMTPTFLLFDQNKFLGELDWDIDLGEVMPKGTQDGFLWVKRTYKDERDYQTFLKVKIVEEKE